MKFQISTFFGVFFAFSVFTITGVAHAKNLSTQTDTKALADKMVSHFIKKEFTEGMSVAKPHWPSKGTRQYPLRKNLQSQGGSTQRNVRRDRA